MRRISSTTAPATTPSSTTMAKAGSSGAAMSLPSDYPTVSEIRSNTGDFNDRAILAGGAGNMARACPLVRKTCLNQSAGDVAANANSLSFFIALLSLPADDETVGKVQLDRLVA